MLVTLPAVPLSGGSAAAAGNDGTITLNVTSSTSSNTGGLYATVTAGQAITEYQWLINLDNTGDSSWDPENCLPPNAKIPGDPVYGTAGDGYGPGEEFPEKCDNPSIRSIPGTAPAMAYGDETELNGSDALNLPNGKYLISITAPGFKIDGVHFTVNGDVQVLNATMNPMPVKTTTVRVNVFNDIAMPDGAWDGLSEPGLNGFTVHINDVLDEVTTDVFGNALCTEYYRNNGETPQDYPLPGGRVDYATFDALPIDLDADGAPIAIESTGGYLSRSRSGCLSVADGQIQIPNLGPNRYAITVIAPDADQHVTDTRANAHNKTIEKWIKTTTLEGGHDWDSWNQEGGTGYDTERVIANEQTPPNDQGFVAVTNALPSSPPAGTTGSVEGQLAIAHVYVPGLSGQQNFADALGLAGTKTAGPVEDGVVALTCIAGCPSIPTDTAVYVQRTDLNVNGEGTGHFKINNVPPGQYTLTMWDEAQRFILGLTQINVVANKNSNIGTFGLTSWFTNISGTVYVDANGNGKQDYTDLNHNGHHEINEPGELGVPRFDIAIRGRDNTLYDQGQNGTVTNENGEYFLDQVYPLTQFLVIEAFNTRYKGTGITFQADNQPEPTTFITAQVDFDFLPIIGLSGTVDWGVQPYAADENGGIVGTVSYDSTRNEHNPAQAGTEDYQPSVAGIMMHLWLPHTNPDGSYVTDPDGAISRFGVGDCAAGSPGCQPYDSYETETWARPKGCIALDAQGEPFTDQMALPDFSSGGIVDPADPAYGDQPDCIEAPMNNVQFGGDGSVDGNYGLAPPNPGDWLVEAVPPTEDDRGVTALNPGRPNKSLYHFTSEESINVFEGDNYVPQNGFNLLGGTPSDPADHVDTSGPPRDFGNVNNPGPVPLCAGPTHVVGVDVPEPQSFVDAIGGSLYAGQARPECNVKLVRVVNGSSVAPTFHVYTDVPIPARFHGIVINDLNLSADPRTTVFGEAAPAPFLPVGVYDELGNHKLTVTSDYNGFYELLVPSTDTYNCPLPAGPCANVYRLVANDPGQPTGPNTDYNPTYRTIATNFQAWPGVIHPVDQAPTSLTNLIMQPGSQLPNAPLCAVNDTVTINDSLLRTPEFYKVSDPIVSSTSAPLTITGAGFGSSAPTVRITPTAGGNSYNLPIDSFTANTITTHVPASIGTTVAGGRYHLKVTGSNGRAAVNGVDIHVVRGSYSPTIYRVGPGRTFDPTSDPVDGNGPRAIQRALNAAATGGNANAQNNRVVVVYPNTSTTWAAFNPNASYFENIVVHSNVKLQGVGAGGPGVPGSSIDGSSFWSESGGADGGYATQWLDSAVALLPEDTTVPNGQVVFEISDNNSNSFTRSVDGFTITGGDQRGFPNAIGETGISTETQGGGVFVLENVRNLAISNNVITGNGGTYGGAIRVGTPGVNSGPTQPNGSSLNNTGLQVINNRIVANGGTFLAGALAIFNGTTNYLVDHNDFCGNYSAEYGGAISHYGLSNNGTISNNRIYFNSAYDEGGGVLIGGELPAVSTRLTQGAGNVTIDANLIQDNLSNDDGGGLRFLMGSGGGRTGSPALNSGGTNWRMIVTNNIIANNVATHEGGGVAIDDTPNIDFIGNTVVRNITTATAITSDGRPAPAGLSTGPNSLLLQNNLPAAYSPKTWSKPNIVNSIFADNRAGSWTPTGITGIGKTGDLTPVVNWDMGTEGGPGTGALTPTYSIIQSLAGAPGVPPGRAGGTGYTSGTGDTQVANIGLIGLNRLFETSVDAYSMRTNPNFRSAMLVVVDTPVTQMGDYHLTTGSMAIGTGTPTVGSNPTTLAHDVDLDARTGPVDRGADELSAAAPNVSVTKSDGLTNVARGQAIQYSIVVSNAGPGSAPGTAVTDTIPSKLTGATWTCTATAGSSCLAASGSGNISTSVSLASAGSATFTVNATVSSTAIGTIVNTANVSAANDSTPGNNSATDTDIVNLPLPVLPLLDNFNRANAVTLGANWSQVSLGALLGAGLRVNGNAAFCTGILCLLPANASWNVAVGAFGTQHGAAFTFTAATADGSSIMLKATPGTGSANAPQNFIRARYSAGNVFIESSTDLGFNFTTYGSFAGTFATGDRLSAVAYSDGSVYVYKTTAALVTTQLGAVSIPVASFAGATGNGRIGLQLPPGSRVDDFRGGIA